MLFTHHYSAGLFFSSPAVVCRRYFSQSTCWRFSSSLLVCLYLACNYVACFSRGFTFKRIRSLIALQDFFVSARLFSSTHKIKWLYVGFLLCFLLHNAVYAAGEMVNINTASPAALAEQLPGIGPAKARAIVTYREQNGPFESVDELIEVKGIGPKTLAAIRPLVFVASSDIQQSTADQSAPIWTALGDIQTGPEVTESKPTLAQQERVIRDAIRAAVNIARRVENGEF